MTESAVIFVNDGMFSITGGSDYSVESADWPNSLAAPMDHGAFVLTGIHTGIHTGAGSPCCPADQPANRGEAPPR